MKSFLVGIVLGILFFATIGLGELALGAVRSGASLFIGWGWVQVGPADVVLLAAVVGLAVAFLFAIVSLRVPSRPKLAGALLAVAALTCAGLIISALSAAELQPVLALTLESIVRAGALSLATLIVVVALVVLLAQRRFRVERSA